MRLISAALALTLTSSAALAADTGHLAAGAPAGVKQAQESNGKIVAFGLGALALGVIIAALSQDDDTPATPAAPTTTTTTTTTAP